jgi:hypothetical protein
MEDLSDLTGQDGNLSVDPMLYDPASGDFHLTDTSPVIGGDNGAGPAGRGLRRDPRILDGNGDELAIVDMGMDEVVGPALHPTSEPAIFSDDFETGDLSMWSSAVTDLGDLSAASAAAIGGSYGLEAVLDDNDSIYLVDESPTPKRSIGAFYFDPNTIAMVSGNLPS